VRWIVRRSRQVSPARSAENVELSTKGAPARRILKLRILRSLPTDGTVAVELRRENSTNVVGADCGGHEGFRESLCQIRKSLGLLQDHDGLHLSAADGGTTMPELAR